MRLVEAFNAGIQSLSRRSRELGEAEAHQLRSRAAKTLDEAWRSKTLAPLCPHCTTAILPEDVVGGVAMTSKDLAIAARNRAAKNEKD